LDQKISPEVWLLDKRTLVLLMGRWWDGPACKALYERRTLHGGWHADPGMVLAKRFGLKDGSNDGVGGDFHGQKRSNKTHESTTDADARLCKKSYGKDSRLSYLGHALVENRTGLIAEAMVTTSMGTPSALQRC
jgi:hypothetical protein